MIDSISKYFCAAAWIGAFILISLGNLNGDSYMIQNGFNAAVCGLIIDSFLNGRKK